MNTVSLHSDVLGTGPDFVLLHGLFGSGNNWRTFAKFFEEDFRIWLVDLRNHGQSPHTDEMNYPLLAADVLRFLEEHALREVTLLGHSMGGKTAMQLALRHPERIRRLIVGDIAPVPYAHQQSHAQLIHALRSVPLTPDSKRAEVQKALQDSIPNLQTLAFLLKNLDLRPEPRWRLNLPTLEAQLPNIMDFPTAPTLPPFAKPTLFVGGANSDYLRAEDHDARQQWFPQHRLVMLKNCGHWLHVDQPEALRQTLRFFFSAT
jgi:pimeloyl-ACP methyl ester carboxylesterase